MRDSYTNSIINDNDAVILKHNMHKHNSENLFHGVDIYAVKTV